MTIRLPCERAACRFINVWALLLSTWGVLVVSSQAFELDTHEAISLVAVRDHSEARVDWFLRNQLGSSLGLGETIRVVDPLNGVSSPTRSLADWIAFGSREEDLADAPTVERVLHHFYNPLRREGLTDATFCGVDRTVHPFSSSVDWAWSGRGRLSGQAPVGWHLARQFFFDALTDTGVLAGRDRMAGTMEALGRIIHLLQDAAQPQHTRNDAHVPSGIGGETSPFEALCGREFREPAQILALPPESVPQLPSPPEDLTRGIDPRFYSLWNTFQYRRSQNTRTKTRPDRDA